MTGMYSAIINDNLSLKLPAKLIEELGTNHVTCWTSKNSNTLCVSGASPEIIKERLDEGEVSKIYLLEINKDKLQLNEEIAKILKEKKVVIIGIGLIIEIFSESNWREISRDVKADNIIRILDEIGL